MVEIGSLIKKNIEKKMRKIKYKLNLLIYRTTGKVLRKEKENGNANWKTNNIGGNIPPKKIFGYKLEHPEFGNMSSMKKWWATLLFIQKKEVSNKTKPLLVVGQGWTGSSAIIAYLCEFRRILQYGTEFRLVKDPGGIIELESAIIDHWTHWNTSVAIKRFIQLAEMHARKDTHKFMPGYLPLGFNCNKFCNGNFMKLTEQYIDDLAFLRFPGNWFMDDCGKTTIGTFWANVKRRSGCSSEEFFVIHPERDKFINATRKYINSIISEFDLYAGRHDRVIDSALNADWVIFDQAIWPQACLKALDYFENAKIIVVDRDPRDVYLSVVCAKSNCPVEKRRSYFPKDPESFARHYRMLMENSKFEENPALLRISFEDFNLKHEETSALVRDFLDMDPQDHLIPHAFYKKEVSSTRVGKWRKCSGKEKEAMEIIAKMLPEYCYALDKNG